MSEKWEISETKQKPTTVVKKEVEYVDSGVWEFFRDGAWHVTALQHNHRQNTELSGIPTRTLYFVK